MDTSKNLSQVIRNRLKANNKRFWAGDNISEFIDDEEKIQLINELTSVTENAHWFKPKRSTQRSATATAESALVRKLVCVFVGALFCASS